jgi:hypothetical protein
MEPLSLLLGAAAAGAAYFGHKKIAEPKVALDPYGQPMISALKKGSTYAILVVLDWQKIPGATPTVPDKDAMSNYMKLIFGGGPGSVTPDGLGFKVLSQPTLRNEDEAKKFFAGQQSAWVLNAQWLRSTPNVEMSADLNKILPTAAVYPLHV